MKIFLCFVFSAFSFILNAQISKDDISFEYLKSSASIDKETSEDYGIELWVNLKYTYVAGLKSFNDIYLCAEILDENGNSIIKSSESEKLKTKVKLFTTKPEGGEKSESNIKIFVPYRYFMKVGKQKVQCNFIPKSSDLKTIYKKSNSFAFDVNVPQMHNLSEQEAKVRDLKMEDGIEKDGIRGIRFSYQCSFKYPSKFIYILNEKSSKKVYFYVNLKSKEGVKIFEPEKDPSQSEYRCTLNRYINMESPEDGSVQRGEIFIPYHNLYASSGTQVIKAELKACDKSKEFEFKTNSTVEANVKVPNIYMAKASVSGMEIERGEYDVAGKNIPFVNIFIGPNSKAGQGYPDVIYYLALGKDNVLASSVNQNSFTASDLTATFRICDNENLLLSAYDWDDLSTNDFLGSYTMIVPPGNTDLNSGKIATKHIINANLDLKKKEIPDFRLRTFEFNQAVVIKEVSGCSVSLDYDVGGMDTKVSVTPYAKDKTGSLKRLKFYENIDTRIEKAGANNSQTFFVPYYELAESDVLGFAVSASDYNFILRNLESEPITNFPESLNDIRYTVSDPKPITLEGINGLTTEIERIIPEKYIKDLGIKIVQKQSFTDGKGNSADTLIRTATKGNINNSLSTNISKSMTTYFIPYYKLSNFQNTAEFKYSITSEVGDKKLVAGRADKKFNISLPQLFRSESGKINFKFKPEKNTEAFYIKVIHDGKTAMQSEKMPVSKKPSIVFKGKLIAHPDDELKIQLISIGWFKTETVHCTWTLKASELNENKEKSISIIGSCGAKKVKVQF